MSTSSTGLPIKIDSNNLWQRLEELATFGALSDGGVNRQALSENERKARRRLMEWADDLGATSHIDSAGNMFFRRAGRAELAPVLIGSHIDSQPNGGRYDGAYGVVSGFALLEAAAREGLEHLRPIEVVVWNNEEGSRYAPGAMGSALFSGRLSFDVLHDLRDEDGIRLVDELGVTIAEARAAGATERGLGFPVRAFVEPHIEQGPVLEQQGKQIGIVTGTQGLRWYQVSVSGASAHAGTTPWAARRDAFVAAIELATVLRELSLDADEALRFTIGRFGLSPNSPNTIAEKADFSIDLRHHEEIKLSEVANAFAELAKLSWAGCSVEMRETMRLSPRRFDQSVTELLEHAARTCGRQYQHMFSGAFHDATNVAEICATAMIFIPCAGGVSHTPAESITLEDALAGAEVAATAVIASANMQA